MTPHRRLSVQNKPSVLCWDAIMLRSTNAPPHSFIEINQLNWNLSEASFSPLFLPPRVILKAWNVISLKAKTQLQWWYFQKKELSYRCGWGVGVGVGWCTGWSRWVPTMPLPPLLIYPLHGTPLPQPESLSRSLQHILSPHLSQHIKLLVLPQLHTRRCCHAKHRSARPSDCWGGRWGQRTSVSGAA